MSRLAKSYREMEVYKEAFAFQQEVFHVSKSWPKEEMYALTDDPRPRWRRGLAAAPAPPPELNPIRPQQPSF